MTRQNSKIGFTLIEVLVVVTIMGILSTMGVVSFRQAIANNRIRDAAINSAAFMERVSMQARQMNDTLCVVAENGGTLLSARVAVTASGNVSCTGDPLETMNLEGGVFLRSNGIDSPKSSASTSLVGNDVAAYFVPRIGLNSFRGKGVGDEDETFEGYWLLQYRGSDTWGGVSKVTTDNRFRAHMSHGAGWSDL